MAFTENTPVIAEGLPITFRDQTVWLNPDDFERSYMLDIDFDETCYTTFISSGDGVEVHQAYEMAVETVLGEGAKQDFSDYGGLSNRAPLDVIIGLVSKDKRLISHALRHARDHFAHPADITDIGLGMIARFADRGRVEPDELSIRAITEMLVIRKKQKLIPQISQEWPMPVKGFVEFWTDLHNKKQDGSWKNVHTAIVSSGHTDFIRLALEQTGLPHPDMYMTDDEMRRQVRPRTKPDPYALELVRNAWLNAYLVPKEKRENSQFMEAVKQRQLYVGDDPKKDGAMAINDGIAFLHHDGSPAAWRSIGNRIMRVIEERGGFND